MEDVSVTELLNKVLAILEQQTKRLDSIETDLRLLRDEHSERLVYLESKLSLLDIIHASQVRMESEFKIWADADSLQSDKIAALTKRVDKIEKHLGFM